MSGRSSWIYLLLRHLVLRKVRADKPHTRWHLSQYLFASKGINASHLRSQIKNISADQPIQPTTSTAPWEPPIPIADTDVEGYRRWRQETIIIAALEQGRRTTQRAVQANLQKRVQEDWKQQREKIMEELSTYGTGEDGGDVAMGVSTLESIRFGM